MESTTTPLLSWFSIYMGTRRCLGRVIVLHLLFIALGFALFSPLTGIFGHLLLSVSGNQVLADTDILFFLLTPYGLTALVLFGALLVAILAFELATILVLCAASRQGFEAGPLAVIFFVLRRSLDIFLFSARLVARILVIILPFLAAAGLIAWYLLTEHDINYYLTDKPPAFIASVLIISLILVMMLICLMGRLISWSLALPFLLFGDTRPAETFRRSNQTIGRQRLKVLKLFTIWLLGVTLLGTLFFMLIQWLSSLVLPLFYNTVDLLIVVLGGMVAINAIGNMFISAISVGSLGIILVSLYNGLEGEIPGEPFAQLGQVGTTNWKPGLLTGALAVVLVSGTVGLWLMQGVQADDDIEIIAHRGAAGSAPENTMASVHRAIEEGTDWIEIDVQESSDGEVVVIHDSDFMKLAKVSSWVWETSFEKMGEIDIGSWFDPSFSTERVPTLQDVLEEARGKARVLVELKYYGHDVRLEQRVVDIVEGTGMVDQTAFMSLKYDGMVKLRTLRPDWDLGLLSTTAVGDLTGLDVEFLAVNSSMARPTLIKSAHGAGKKVLVWTINDPLTMFKMASLGIDGIITDEPGMARELLAERAELSSVERLLLHTAIMLGEPVPTKTYRDKSP